jgi:AcrR family transcriptional regulator
MSGSHSPPPQDPAATLLSAAREIFVAEGVKGLSVRRVSERAGCTTMAVYSRFGGKEGLLAALFDEGFERLAEAQDQMAKTPAGAPRVVKLCRAYRATAQEFPHHYALMLGQFSGEHTPSPASSAKAMATLHTLIDAVAATLPASAAGAQRATQVANRLFAFCHGWVSLERLGFFGSSTDVEGSFELAVATLLSG